MNNEKRDEGIRLTIKIYPHKHGEELASEIIEYLGKIERWEKEESAETIGVKE